MNDVAVKIELKKDMYDEAREAKLTFSQYLEDLDPTSEGSKLDAFQRQLRAGKVFTKSVPEKGIWASTVEAFYRTEHNQILFPEFVARQVREAIVEDVMLPYLIGMTTPINTDTYRTFYVDDQPDKQKKKRVTEAAELPRVSIKGREQMVKIYKYGRAIEASYEVLRRMQIDMLALHIGRIAMQTAKEKVSDILTVVQAGDGNNNAAATVEQRNLDAGATTAKVLTPRGFLRFLMEFQEFPCDTLIGGKDAVVQLLMANIPNMSVAEAVNLLTPRTNLTLSLNSPQMPAGNLRVFWHDDVDDNKLVGINRAMCIEQVQEVGSDIYEASKFITRQTEVLTISETLGYSKMFKEAAKILDFATAAS